jgi:hypothetical protein
MKYKLICICLLVAFTVSLTSCNSSSSSDSSDTEEAGNPDLGSGSGTSSITNAVNLPRANDKVIASGNSSSSVNTLAAVSGLPFAPSASSEFGNITYSDYLGTDNYASYLPPTTGSYAACEALNKVRGVYGQLSEFDSIACIIGKLVGTNISSSDFVIKEIIVDEGGETEKMKMKYRILSNDGSISAFEAYVCTADENGSYYQDGYLAQDFSDGEVTMYSKGFTYPDNEQVESVKYVATATASGVNSAGQLLDEKTMTYKYQNIFTDGRNNHVQANIEVTPTLFKYNGYACEKNSLNESTCDTHSESFNLAAQILDLNPTGERNPNKFALGNGSTWMSLSEATGIQSWIGSTGKVDTSSTTDAYRELVDESSTIEISTTISGLDFSDYEVWDCSGEPDEILSDSTTINNLMTCMEETTIDQDVHLECTDYGLSKATE